MPQTDEKILGDPAINTVALLTRHHLRPPGGLGYLREARILEKPLAINEEACRDRIGYFNRACKRVAPHLRRPCLQLASSPFCSCGADEGFLDGRSEPLAMHCVNAGYLPLGHWLRSPASGRSSASCRFYRLPGLPGGRNSHFGCCAGLPDRALPGR
jgi:hypothetical protein